MTQDQLRAAHELIEQGRVEEARRLLQTLDDPVARQWLAQLNASKRPPKRQLSLPLPFLVAIAVVIGILACGVMLLLTPTLVSRIQDQSSNQAANPVSNQSVLTVDDQLQAKLVQYCTPVYGYGVETCQNWADQVRANFHDAAVACSAQYSVDTPQGRTDFGACLDANGIPLPT